MNRTVWPGLPGSPGREPLPGLGLAQSEFSNGIVRCSLSLANHVHFPEEKWGTLWSVFRASVLLSHEQWPRLTRALAPRPPGRAPAAAAWSTSHLQPVFIQRHSGGLGQKRGLRLCAFCFQRGCGACIGWGHPRAYKGDTGWEQSPSPVGAALPSCAAVGASAVEGRGRASRGLIVCACGGYI